VSVLRVRERGRVAEGNRPAEGRGGVRWGRTPGGSGERRGGKVIRDFRSSAQKLRARDREPAVGNSLYWSGWVEVRRDQPMGEAPQERSEACGKRYVLKLAGSHQARGEVEEGSRRTEPSWPRGVVPQSRHPI
jgi:hypothetical protein